MALVEPWLWPYITLGCSLGTFWFGNHYALGRDKRREWNDLTLERYDALRREVRGGGEDLALVEAHLPFYRRRGFRKALARYQEAAQARQKAFGETYDPGSGESRYPKSIDDHLKRCAIALLGYYGRR